MRGKIYIIGSVDPRFPGLESDYGRWQLLKKDFEIVILACVDNFLLKNYVLLKGIEFRLVIGKSRNILTRFKYVVNQLLIFHENYAHSNCYIIFQDPLRALPTFIFREILLFFNFRVNAQLIVECHGDVYNQFSNYYKNDFLFIFKIFEKHIVDYVVKSCDKLRVCSKSVLKVVKKDKIYIIPPFFSVDSSKKSKKIIESHDTSLKLLYIGALESVKRVDLLISVVKKIILSGNEVSLTICGTGSLESSLKKMTDDQNLTANIKFEGHVSSDRIFEFLNLSNVLLLVSTSEGFPRVIVEGIATDIFIFSTNVGDIEEMSKGYNKMVFVKQDATEIANLLLSNSKYILSNSRQYKPCNNLLEFSLSYLSMLNG